MSSVMPAEVFPPGEYLADELEARGWSQADFAEIIGRPEQFVSELIAGKRELTPESASQIAAALGTEASTWLGLQVDFNLWKLRRDPRRTREAKAVSLRARVSEVIPLAPLVRRGAVSTDDLEGLWESVRRDFNMHGDEDAPQLVLAAKRSNREEQLSLPQRGWAWLALRVARERTLPAYDEEGFRSLCSGLSHSVREPGDLRDVPARFAAVGVRLIYVEQLPGGKIDGAAFLVDRMPTIALSGRGKRFDKIFFALMHEASHVLCQHLEDGIQIDDASEDGRGSEIEDEANELAQRLCFGGPITMSRGITRAAVQAKAEALDVPYALVVGNLQHHRRLDWRSTLAKGLPNADEVLRSWT